MNLFRTETNNQPISIRSDFEKIIQTSVYLTRKVVNISRIFHMTVTTSLDPTNADCMPNILTILPRFRISYSNHEIDSQAGDKKKKKTANASWTFPADRADATLHRTSLNVCSTDERRDVRRILTEGEWSRESTRHASRSSSVLQPPRQNSRWKIHVLYRVEPFRVIVSRRWFIRRAESTSLIFVNLRGDRTVDDVIGCNLICAPRKPASRAAREISESVKTQVRRGDIPSIRSSARSFGSTVQERYGFTSFE